MRRALAVIPALLGGYLLWQAFRLARVLLVLTDPSMDGTLIVLAAVLAGVGLALLGLAWWLFRPRAGETKP